MKITQQHLDELAISHPTLTWGGFSNWGGRITGLATLKEIQAASDWLASQEIGRKVTKRSHSSYTLKHVAEDVVGFYIPTGAIIAAAIIMDLPYQRDGVDALIPVKHSPANQKKHKRTCGYTYHHDFLPFHATGLYEKS